MDIQILMANLTNPTLLFFCLGLFAALIKSDLEIPGPIVKFISLYLLFSIGFKGGQELSHSSIDSEILYSLLFGLLIASTIPFVTFFILKRKIGPSNAGAVAATYGSVSAVTFVSAASYLESRGLNYGGHMVAVMALMEAPAIIFGVLLMKKFTATNQCSGKGIFYLLRHSFSNGSVLLIIGSLLIGTIADNKQAEGIKPFTTDIFKGFLSIFLLEMGMVTANRIQSCFKYGLTVCSFALIAPIINGSVVAYFSQFVTLDTGNRFMFAILSASASYIAVPATMRIAAPEADPGLYIPMALGITFPFNITIGMPLFIYIIA